MPYITESRKDILRFNVPQNSGELNYAITNEIVRYLYKHGLNYETCNEIVGALDNAKDEFKRRILNPYEDKAIERNGDVGYDDFIQ